MAKKKTADSAICRNRKATFRFELLEKLDCGLVLKGTEVKSLPGEISCPFETWHID